MIIDIEYLKNNVINEELYELCLSDEAKVLRYLNIVTTKIKSFLDIEQFKQGTDYIFPADLQEVTRFLVESLYLNRNLNSSQGRVSQYTEKHDDYSDSKTFHMGDSVLRYGIPLLTDYLEILKKYQNKVQFAPTGRIGLS